MNKLSKMLKLQGNWELVLELKLTKEESRDFNRICKLLCDEAKNGWACWM